jgi:predicted aspartyl protease
VFDPRSEEEFCLDCRVDTGFEYLSIPVYDKINAGYIIAKERAAEA